MGVHAIFPPKIVVEIKALACELPSERDLPFSRFSTADIVREAVRRGIVASISNTTVWRWLDKDAIKPWSYRSWIFPRDPQFAEKAGRVIDLYQGFWEDKPLNKNDYVISADEKTSIQPRKRLIPTSNPAPNKCQRVEFEYERCGSLAYIAAWDVHQANLFGICEKTTGVKEFQRLVDLVMRQEPYKSANRVFWITDNGSSHRGEKSIQRLSEWYSNAILVHTPVHASWLNQIEIYFSIVKRKVLTPNNYENLDALEKQLIKFQSYYKTVAKPFEWKFTKDDLNNVIKNVSYYQIQKEQYAA